MFKKKKKRFRRQEQGKRQGNQCWDSAKRRPGPSHSLSAPKQMGDMNIPNKALGIQKQNEKFRKD